MIIIIERALRVVIVILAMLIVSVVGYSISPQVEPAGATPEQTVSVTDWADGDNTNSAWNICLWVGARDLGTSFVYLRRGYNIDWYGDAWLACHYEIKRPVGELFDRSCAYNITDRDRADSVLGTYWSFGPYDFNGCRN